MKIPLQITFRDIDRSDAMEAAIREKADKLDRFYAHIMSCRVAVSREHQHRHQGNLYQVHIDITVPNHEIVVTRSPDQHHAHEDFYVALRDAFNAATRQLENHVRKQRGDVKHHEQPEHGVITRLNPEQDFGWLRSADGLEVYFHRNSLLEGEFDDLEVGYPVRFSKEAGEQGPQASSVHRIGKHHIVG